MKESHIPRTPEPEYMDVSSEAAAYARADFSEVNAEFVERLVRLARVLQRAKTLDVGTGPADIPIRVVRACPDWEVVAIDASEAMLEHARAAVQREGLSGSIELMLGDAKDTGLPGRSFDVIFSNSILHHINAVDSFWSELKRLAKSGSLVFLRDLLRPPTRVQAMEIVRTYAGDESELLRDEFYRSLLSAYTVDEVRAQLDRNGLEMLEVAKVTDRHLDVFGHLP